MSDDNVVKKSGRTRTEDKLVGVPDHPVAAGVGAVLLGGASGAAAGTVVGPVGTAVGAIVGAVAGALGGDAVASSVEEVHEDSEETRTAETEKWR